MTAPLLFPLSHGCCGTLHRSKHNDKIFRGAQIFDILTTITSLVLGLLGACSVISMPMPAAYALLGVSGAIPVLWIAAIAYNNIRSYCAKRAFQEHTLSVG